MNVINREAVTSFITKDTSLIREIMRPNNSQIERQSLAEATVRPGAATMAHSHPNTEEIYYILSGYGEMAVESERRNVGPGDAIGIPAGHRHQIRNVGDEDLVLLCCCAPAYTDADTVLCAPLLV